MCYCTWRSRFRSALQTQLFKVNSLWGKITLLSHLTLRLFFTVKSIFLVKSFHCSVCGKNQNETIIFFRIDAVGSWTQKRWKSNVVIQLRKTSPALFALLFARVIYITDVAIFFLDKFFSRSKLYFTHINQDLLFCHSLLKTCILSLQTEVKKK